MRFACNVRTASLALGAILLAAAAAAYPGGVGGTSVTGCGPCHSGGPGGTTVTLTGPSSVTPGSVNEYRLSVPAGIGGGGMNVSVTSGTLAGVAGTSGTGRELTHSSAVAREWTFTFTAPLANLNVDLHVAAMAANGDSDVAGDAWDVLTRTIQVSGSLPTDTDGDGTADAADCAPTNPNVHPAAFENCVNGIDDNCNGIVDGAEMTCGAVAPARLLGDIAPRGALDEQVSIADVVLLLRFAVGLDVMSADERISADVAPGRVTLSSASPPIFSAAPDGLVNIGDAVVVLRAAVGLIRIDPPLPFQGENNLIAFHSNAWLQDAASCRSCHGSMMSQARSTPTTPAFHPRHLPLLPSYTCVTCHQSVDLLQKSGAMLRKQVHVEVCATCHAPGGPGAAAGYRLYLQ